ncbi:MAG: hypothetical protein ABI112_17895 [Terracoccus sp.]
MATRKTPAKKTAATKPAATNPATAKPATTKPVAKKTTARKAPAKKATTRRRPTTRRPQPALSTTIGSALGALVVTTLLDLTWPVRIALIAAVLLVGLGYLLWKNRSAIAAEAGQPVGTPEPPATAPPPTDQP